MGSGRARGFSEGSDRLAGDKGQKGGKIKNKIPRRTSKAEKLRTDRKQMCGRGSVSGREEKRARG